MSDLFRVYWDPAEIGPDGYPFAWHEQTQAAVQNGLPNDGPILNDAIKGIVREQAGHRCVRCGHPYEKGSGEWSLCDERCTHVGPLRMLTPEGWQDVEPQFSHAQVWEAYPDFEIEAQWRILTVHHLNGVKHDCRWWNLTSLCQRCHLTIQGKVYLERPWRREHSEWFKPYVAGFYAWHFLGEEISRDAALSRLDELLALEHVQMELA